MAETPGGMESGGAGGVGGETHGHSGWSSVKVFRTSSRVHVGFQPGALACALQSSGSMLLKRGMGGFGWSVRGNCVKDDTGCKAALAEQGASASHLPAAKVHTIFILPGMGGEANDAVVMKDAPRLLQRRNAPQFG